ncbi:hypothetical protein HAX54_033988, partial [Datura stramonium]|nr:hypothetical protein [Datura stramonium]
VTEEMTSCHSSDSGVDGHLSHRVLSDGGPIDRQVSDGRHSDRHMVGFLGPFCKKATVKTMDYQAGNGCHMEGFSGPFCKEATVKMMDRQ